MNDNEEVISLKYVNDGDLFETVEWHQKEDIGKIYQRRLNGVISINRVSGHDYNTIFESTSNCLEKNKVKIIRRCQYE